MRKLVCLGATVLALFTVGCGGDDANVDRTIPVTDTSGIGGTPIPVIGPVTVSPVNATITPGQQVQFAASTQFGNETDRSTWTSSNSGIASVSTTGLVTGNSPGTVTITATTPSGALGSTTLTVGQAAVTSLMISPNPIQLALNTRLQLNATSALLGGGTQDVTTQVTWSTGNNSVAQVSNTGELIAVGPGTTTVIAQQGATTGTATVTVSAATLRNVTFQPLINTLRVGQQIQMTALGTFSDGTTQDITNSASWTSSNPNVAGVSNTIPKGVLVGASPGTSIIQASIGEVGASFNLGVTP